MMRCALIATAWLSVSACSEAQTIDPPSQTDWVASKQYIQINSDVRMAYVEWGDPEGEPVLLIHGYSDNSRVWGTIAPYLKDRHYFAIDMRGHGDTSIPECCFYLSDFAEDASDFIHAQGFDSMDVVGHSLGSGTAGVLASMHPEEVSKLVLVSSAPFFGNGVSWLNDALAEAQFPLDPEGTFIQTWAYNPGNMDETMLGPLRYEEAAMPERVWKSIARGLEIVNWGPAAARITAPALILWGDQDELILEADQVALRAALPDAKFIRYDGLGHSMYWEDPARVASDLLRFLDE
ncbi:MAG: alpha/beta hydrolase [Ponticaulis sp.]|nr:alpha/beta hydrolase [Ponticaulis sp.]